MSNAQKAAADAIDLFAHVSHEVVDNAIASVCADRQTFTTEDVWAVIPPELRPDEPRYIGAAMVRAKRSGLCRPTMNYQQGTRAESHARPVRVWESLVYKGK